MHSAARLLMGVGAHLSVRSPRITKLMATLFPHLEITDLSSLGFTALRHPKGYPLYTAPCDHCILGPFCPIPAGFQTAAQQPADPWALREQAVEVRYSVNAATWHL